MIKNNSYTILSNTEINTDIYEMVLTGDTSPITNPGEFVHMKIDDTSTFLRRPISIAYHDDKEIWLAYKVVGKGTAAMAKMEPNTKVDMLVGCGNGFDLNAETKKPLLIGGGMGVAPLYNLAKKLYERGLEPTLLIGFKTVSDIFYWEDFDAQFKTYLAIEKSKVCPEKRVTDILKELDPDSYDYFYACGPEPMQKAIYGMVHTDGEFSLESRMGCGTGLCKCCSIETTEGMQTICKDGPVFKKRMVRW